MSPRFLDRSLLRDPHPVLDLGEGLLDRVEVGRVWWQEPEPCACSHDHLADGGRLVRAQIVHHDDVAGLEHWHELLLDPGTEAFAVDRPVEDARCHQPVRAQRAEESERAPVAMWSEAAQAFAFGSPTSEWGHVGLDPRLVDEDQPARVQAGLEGAPALASPDDVGASLLKGEQRFF